MAKVRVLHSVPDGDVCSTYIGGYLYYDHCHYKGAAYPDHERKNMVCYCALFQKELITNGEDLLAAKCEECKAATYEESK